MVFAPALGGYRTPTTFTYATGAFRAIYRFLVDESRFNWSRFVVVYARFFLVFTTGYEIKRDFRFLHRGVVRMIKVEVHSGEVALFRSAIRDYITRRGP